MCHNRTFEHILLTLEEIYALQLTEFLGLNPGSAVHQIHFDEHLSTNIWIDQVDAVHVTKKRTHGIFFFFTTLKGYGLNRTR